MLVDRKAGPGYCQDTHIINFKYTHQDSGYKRLPVTPLCKSCSCLNGTVFAKTLGMRLTRPGAKM